MANYIKYNLTKERETNVAIYNETLNILTRKFCMNIADTNVLYASQFHGSFIFA